jgi:uncharacterized protein YgbK (DUF1537 family)
VGIIGVSTGRTAAVPQLVLADDLTGACDAGVAFAVRGSRVRVTMAAQHSCDADVCCVSTNSRALPPEHAATLVRQQLRARRADTQIFKKLDSVFRGNTLHELRAALEGSAATWVLCAPAYPALRRTVRAGVLSFAALERTETLDLKAALRSMGIAHELVTAANELDEAKLRAEHAGVRLLLCDAVTQPDLLALVHAQQEAGESTLWAGSAGLAHALAEHASARQTTMQPACFREGRMLFCIGSTHAVTQQQVHRLNAGGCTVQLEAGARAPDGTEDLVLRVGSDVAALRDTLASLHVDALSMIFVTGGDTATIVCRALQAESLELKAEVEPGMPVALIEGGPWSGVPLVLKSGGFGDECTLLRLQACRGTQAEVRRA